MKRILYFVYFIINTDYPKLAGCFREVKRSSQLCCLKIFFDLVVSSFKYKASFHDFFLFEFHKKDHEQRNSYITAGRLYEFYTKMNDKKKASIFKNKARFNKAFGKYIKRDFLLLDDNCTVDQFINWTREKECIIAKPAKGARGKGIEKIALHHYENGLEVLYSYFKKKKLDLIEDCIKQHEDMNRLNFSSVNSIRIFTVRCMGKTDIIGAVLRMGLDSHVDNFSAGGIAAPIDIETGVVSESAISKNNVVYEKHPNTKCVIKGFKVPYWSEVIKIVKELSAVIPEVRTVGWDIAITETGPELIEGNDNWNKDAFQAAYREGKQHLLDSYIFLLHAG